MEGILLWTHPRPYGYGYFLELHIVKQKKSKVNSSDIISGDNDSDDHRRKRKTTKKHHKLVHILLKKQSKKPYNKQLINLKCLVYMENSQTLALPYWPCSQYSLGLRFFHHYQLIHVHVSSLYHCFEGPWRVKSVMYYWQK